MPAIRFLASLFGIALALAVALPAQDTWEWRSPTPTGNRLVSFAYGHGRFVGVGESGAIATSPDGVTWTNRDSAVFERLTRVVFDGTLFVAAGGHNLLSSPDGTTWTLQSAPAAVLDLACGNGTFVALVEGATAADVPRFLVSSTGQTWTLRENSTGLTPSGLLYANGVFLAVCPDGHVLRSIDALAWTPVVVAPSGATTSGDVPHTAAGNGRFVVSFAGLVYYSTDGLAWSNQTTMSLLYFPPPQPTEDRRVRIQYLGNLGFAHGKFYLDGGHHSLGVFTSTDAVTWTPLVQHSPGYDEYNPYFLDFSTLAAGNDIVIASENVMTTTGGFFNPRACYIHCSANGDLPSTSATSAAVTAANQLVYGLGRFFIGGKSSNDGVTWADCGFEPTQAAGDRLFRIVSLSTAGQALSEITAHDGATTSVAVSSDGFTATTVDPRVATPHAVAFGANRYVIVGENGAIAISADALNWTPVASGTTKNLTLIIHAFNRFIAAGTDGTLLTSADGLTWSDRSVPALAGGAFLSLAAGTDRVLATVASIAAVPVSVSLDDGLPVFLAASHRFTTSTFFNGTFLAVSTEPSAAYGVELQRLWQSADGANWTEVRLHLGPSFRTQPVVGNGTAMLLAAVALDRSFLYQANSPALLQTRSLFPSLAPTIIAAPVAKEIHRGESVSFAIGVTGSGPFSYQWYRNGAALAGATQSILTFNLPTEIAAGDYTVVVANSAGSVTSAPAHLTVDPPIPLTITQRPVGGKISNGSVLVLNVAVTGSGPITYQWRKDGTPVSGATSASYSVHGVSSSPEWSVGLWDVVVTAPCSTVTSESVVVKWADAAFSAPAILHAPVSDAVRAGGFTALWIDVASSELYAYQWRHNGVAIPGATSTTLWLHNFSAADAGTYDVVIRSPDFTTTISPAATLTYSWSRLSNLSALGFAGTGEETFFQGFVLNGTTDDPAAGPLIRSIGPGLVPLGLEHVLPDPVLTVLSLDHTVVAANDNWSTPPTLTGLPATAAAMSSLGAFALAPGSLDGALQLPASRGGLFLIQTSGANAATGYVLNEIYAPDLSSPRLVNLSARSRVGERPLIAGFVIAGNLPLRVLLRAVGPTLATQGVAHPLAHPKLTLYNSAGHEIDHNDSWSAAANLADLRTAAATTGAFALTEGSNDAAMLTTLAPGVYSVHVTSVDATSGVALVEIYEAP